MVQSTYTYTVVLCPSGQSAVYTQPSRQSPTVALPRQPCTAVALAQWQSATVMQATYT